MGALFDTRVYKLAGDSTVVRDGFVETRTISAGLYLDLTPVKGLNVSLGLGHSLFREITIYSDDGDELNAYDVDPSLGGILSVSYRF